MHSGPDEVQKSVALQEKSGSIPEAHAGGGCGPFIAYYADG